jgi:hypothetical protein
MTHFSTIGITRFAVGLLAICSTLAIAAPGAHGPGGEHLDAPVGATASASATPRFEAQTETFELVGRLSGTELSLLIDRYESNEPVRDAQVNIESGAFKASAKFRPENGDYVVVDAPMLKHLAAAGEHAVVVTVRAGQDADLLDGTLVVGPGGQADAGAGHGHAHDGDDHDHDGELALWMAGGLVALGGVAALAMLVARRRRQGPAASAAATGGAP